VEVLQGTTLDIHRREFLTLFGPSGCGKSTLLNIVAGLVKPYGGQTFFQGELIQGINRSIGYMTQDDTLLPWRTLYKNVALPLELRKVRKREIRSRVGDYLDLLDLAHAADRYPAQLSGGMKRRALLARSMIYEPEMLLMDEPFAALDEITRFKLNNDLLELWHASNFTVVFVTHSVFESVFLSQRIVTMAARPGRVIADMDVTAPYPRAPDHRTSPL